MVRHVSRTDGRTAPSAPAPASAWATPVNGRSDDSGGGGIGAMGGLGCNGRGSVVRGHSLSPAASKKQFPRRRLRSLPPRLPDGKI